MEDRSGVRKNSLISSQQPANMHSGEEEVELSGPAGYDSEVSGRSTAYSLGLYGHLLLLTPSQST